MKLVIHELEERISAAMGSVAGVEGCAAIVRPSTDPQFGDYQANGVMALAKKVKTNPRKLAEDVVKILDLGDICEPPEVAGPGFINLRLKADFLADRLLEISTDYVDETYPDGIRRPYPRLGISKVANPKTIVLDFSSPNIAKEMHVGHLRSTIIGDCIWNILQILGHKVIPQNHIGDWGTQFGMLCALLSKKIIATAGEKKEVSNAIILADLEAFYREAKQLFDNDDVFAEEAREAIAGLHAGKQVWTTLWREIVRESEKHYQYIYDRLGVLLGPHSRGESAYKDDLAGVVGELKQKGLAVESDGAVCVFPPGFKNKEGEPLPFIIQKSDGAYLYALCCCSDGGVGE